MIPELSAIARQAALEAERHNDEVRMAFNPDESKLIDVVDAVTTAVLQEVTKYLKHDEDCESRFCECGEEGYTNKEGESEGHHRQECTCGLDALLALSAPLLQSTESKELMRATPTRESIEPLPNASETEGRTDKERWNWGDWAPCSQHSKADHELVCFECNPALNSEPVEPSHDIGDEKRAAIYRRLHQDFQMVVGLSDSQLHHLSLIGAATTRELLWQLGSLESMLVSAPDSSEAKRTPDRAGAQRNTTDDQPVTTISTEPPL